MYLVIQIDFNYIKLLETSFVKKVTKEVGHDILVVEGSVYGVNIDL